LQPNCGAHRLARRNWTVSGRLINATWNDGCEQPG
jgi:hypothetical protein